MTEGGSERRRRIRIKGSGYADLVGALAQTLGIEIDGEEPCDLVVLEADRPELLAEHRGQRTMVIAPRRLRYGEALALREAGARWVIDSEGSVLDAAFALSELLFETIAEQRRYWRMLGGAEVLYWRLRPDAETTPMVAQLVGLAREGGFLRSTERPEEGTPIEIALDLPAGQSRIRGRVAYAAEDGFAVEFALDDQHVAPRLDALVAKAAVRSPPRRGRRRESETAI